MTNTKKLKNKTTLYAVMRKDMDKRDFPSTNQDVVCCFAKSLDGAERLCGEYEQAFYDSGGTDDEAYFYVVGNVYYDE